MPAYLLAWNPKRAKFDNLLRVVNRFNNGRAPTIVWSCGNVKRIKAGDRVFLIRLAVPPKGIFAFGTVIKGSHEDTHWRDSGRTTQYVECQVDWIVDPHVGPIIPRERLKIKSLSKMRWDTQMSGVRIPDKIAQALRSEWLRITSAEECALPDEIDATLSYFEGAKRLITVNAYERNPLAREACISHHGTSCVICGFRFADVYGKVGDGLIHVHHLTLVSEKAKHGKEYKLNPIRDLRPVCPNCHTIIHRRLPPYTLKQVRRMLKKSH